MELVALAVSAVAQVGAALLARVQAWFRGRHRVRCVGSGAGASKRLRVHAGSHAAAAPTSAVAARAPATGSRGRAERCAGDHGGRHEREQHRARCHLDHGRVRRASRKERGLTRGHGITQHHGQGFRILRGGTAVAMALLVPPHTENCIAFGEETRNGTAVVRSLRLHQLLAKRGQAWRVRAAHRVDRARRAVDRVEGGPIICRIYVGGIVWVHRHAGMPLRWFAARCAALFKERSDMSSAEERPLHLMLAPKKLRSPLSAGFVVRLPEPYEPTSRIPMQSTPSF